MVVAETTVEASIVVLIKETKVSLTVVGLMTVDGEIVVTFPGAVMVRDSAGLVIQETTKDCG